MVTIAARREKNVNVAPIVLTCGDVAGVGPEIAAKTRGAVVIGCAQQLRFYGANVHVLNTLSDWRSTPPNSTAVLDVPLTAPWQAGTPTLAGAYHAWQCLQLAVDFCLNKQASAMVTGPIHKATMYAAGFTYAGQTEFLQHACHNVRPAVMMLVGKTLRVVPITVHIALAQVAEQLSTALIVRKALATHEALQRDFGIAQPRLAVAALNPHAGESGTMGREEIDIIAPAVAQLQAQQINITPPQPCDTLFHTQARRQYHAVLCMYHDQALLPLKTLYFNCGVNVSLNLPIVRTSPDHGTAFNIAGRGVALTQPTQAAIDLARRMVAQRARSMA